MQAELRRLCDYAMERRQNGSQIEFEPRINQLHGLQEVYVVICLDPEHHFS